MNMKLVSILLGVLIFAGCQSKQPTSSDKAAGKSQPLSAHGTEPQSAPETNPVKGKVLEKLDAGRYSYMRLQTASGEMWAAIPQAAISVGTDVTVMNPMPMDGFETKTLNRKFDKIVFGTLDQGGPASAGMQAPPEAPLGMASTADTEKIHVEKAPGSEGRTVAEIFAQKGKLKDQKVAVRGKVVKVNAAIMDRNWIHLRDGSGDRKAGTDDMTVTTQSTASIGDIVLVKGTVRIDKKLGMAHTFPVIIEDGTITKQ
jgi:hypothetical protein